jgi:RIO-like serine/threonine protein kinase
MTELDGWSMSRKETRAAAVDPFNYKSIDIKKIAETLHMKKKDVKESLKVLIREEIIEPGDSLASNNGYRFRF